MSGGHDSLEAHIHSNYYLMIHGHMSLETINNMLPWERQVYVGMYVDEQKRKQREADRVNAGTKR